MVNEIKWVKTHTHTHSGIRAPLWCVYMSKAPLLLILIGPHRRRIRPAFDPKSSKFPPFSQMIRGSGLLPARPPAWDVWLVDGMGGGEKGEINLLQVWRNHKQVLPGGTADFFLLLGWLSGPQHTQDPRLHSNSPSSASEGLWFKGRSPLQSKTSPLSVLRRPFALTTARCSGTLRRGPFSPHRCLHTWTASWRGKSRRP